MGNGGTATSPSANRGMAMAAPTSALSSSLPLSCAWAGVATDIDRRANDRRSSLHGLFIVVMVARW